jgi:hypothetical protein
MDYELRINCPLCNQPVSLNTDTYADENGKVVHQGCYQERVIGTQSNSSFTVEANLD